MGVGIVFPHPLFVLAVVLPLVTIWLGVSCPEEFSMRPKKDGREDLSVPIYAPAFMLVSVAAAHANLLHSTAIVGPTLIAFLLIVAGLSWKVPVLNTRLADLGLAAALCTVYLVSSVTLLNRLLDYRDNTQFVLPIVSKRVTTGKGSTSYLSVPIWRERSDLREFQVPRPVYTEAHIGGSVCLTVHPGALALEWYELSLNAECTKNTDPH
jgi:hypothetical protein